MSSPGKFSTYLALGSFAIGTQLLLLHFLFPEYIFLLFIGYIYVAATVVINFIAFLCMVYYFIIYRMHRQIIAIRILILLANIPIAFLYFKIILITI